jgi:hypothetical protein
MPVRSLRRRLYLYTATSHPDIRSIIITLVNGVDISLIDPALFPAINAQLDSQILRFQDAKDQFGVDRLQSIRRYITEEYPEQQERDRLLILRPKPKPVKPQPFSEQELDSIVTAILDGDRSQSYNSEQLDAIVDNLKTRREWALANDDYIGADQIEDAMRAILRRADAVNALKIQETRAEEMAQKVDEARHNLADLIARWEVVVANFVEQRDRELSEIWESNQKALADVEKLKDDPLPARFRKYSPHLLDMRRRERALVSSKRYDEACVLQAEADRNQAVEDERNRADYIASINDQLQKLAAKLDQAYNVRQMNLAKEEHTIRRQMNIEIGSARKMVQHLERALQACVLLSLDDDAPQPAKSQKSSLPLLDLPGMGRPEALSPQTFRQRAILNMKIYTRLPPKTAR